MRTGQPIIGRPAWYDRNPISRAYIYEATLAPHSVAERISYTCPSGKKAMVELVSARVERISAATIASEPKAFWELTPSGGSAKEILRAVIRTNNVGDKEFAVIPTSLTIFSGDAIKGWTADLSTGGLVTYYLTLKITEFDA